MKVCNLSSPQIEVLLVFPSHLALISQQDCSKMTRKKEQEIINSSNSYVYAVHCVGGKWDKYVNNNSAESETFEKT